MLLCALVMALSLRSRNCPRESPRAGAASLLVGVAWEDEGRGAGERGLRTFGALLGLGVLSGAGQLVLGDSAGGSAETAALLVSECEQAASLDSFRVQAMHIHCVGCTLLERRRASWTSGMPQPHTEQGGGGGGAITGGAGCGLAGE